MKTIKSSVTEIKQILLDSYKGKSTPDTIYQIKEKSKGRGLGVFVMKVLQNGDIDFYFGYFVDGKPKSKKIGRYGTTQGRLTLAKAKAEFRELPAICGHIRDNRSLLPSNPNWNSQLDREFEVCVESIAFIENVVGQFPSYLRLPHIQFDGYSQREEVHTMECIAGKLQLGWFIDRTDQNVRCQTVWDAITSAYQQGLSYKNHDGLYNKESINQMIIDNDKIARKLERALPKGEKIAQVKVMVDRTAYEVKKTEWRNAVAEKKQAMLDWDIKIRKLNNEMQAEKNKAGITR